MNYSEKVAKQVIEALLPGATMNFRPQQSDGEYDFDLRRENGQTVPVEVTISTDKPNIRFETAIRDMHKGGPFVAAHLCHQSWYVLPKQRANANKIRQNIDAYLADIEAEGRKEFFVFTDALECPAVKRIYMDLGIEAGQVFKWQQPGLIGISLPSLGSEINPEYVLGAVELETVKSDNRRKLGNRNSDESHLFVYIEHRNFPAWLAINDSDPPSQLPSLPEEITHLWVAASTRESEKYVVWQASAREKWFRSVVKATDA